MQYVGDILWDDSFVAYSEELMNSGFPGLMPIFSKKNGCDILQKSNCAFAPHRVGIADVSSLYKLMANADRIYNKVFMYIPYGYEFISAFKMMLELIGTDDESLFTSNLNKWNKRGVVPNTKYALIGGTSKEQIKFLYKLAIDDYALTELEEALTGVLPKENQANGNPNSMDGEHYAEEDIEIFQNLKSKIKYINKLFVSQNAPTKNDQIESVVKTFTEKRGLLKFVNFPRRVYLHDITEEPFDTYNSDNYAFYDKYYTVKEDSKFSHKSIRLITDKRPDTIKVPNNRPIESKDGSISLSIAEEDQNSPEPLYTLTVDTKYVELRPTFYITINPTPAVTHPSPAVQEMNLDYYHLLLWDSTDIYIALNVFQIGVFGRNKVQRSMHGNVVAVAYTYEDAKRELERAVSLFKYKSLEIIESSSKGTDSATIPIEKFDPMMLNTLNGKRRLKVVKPSVGAGIARITKYKESDSLEYFLEVQQEHARDGQNGAEATETAEIIE